MFNNYTLKSLLSHFSSSGGSAEGVKSSSNGFKLGVVLTLLFAITSIQAQTTIISSAGDGGFNNGSTFAANGWTVANQGTGATKWALGTAVSASNTSTTQLTNASVLALTQSITLAASNTNICIGQAVSGSNIAAGTYVSNISGTTLTLSRPTTNAATVTTAFTLTFATNPANITGNSAYVSTDNGVSNGYNYSAARRIYFYRDVTLPSGETAYSLSFDVRSLGTANSDAWQVLVAPTSLTPVGLDSQSTNVLPSSGFSTAVVPTELAGATSLTYGAGNIYTQRMFASIPPSFAGQTVRLIFMWTNDASGGTSNPAAIDNISLTSRVAGDVNSVASGIFSNPATWDVGVPTAADNMIVNAGNAVNIDMKELTVAGLYVTGSSAFLDYGFFSDELAITGDMQVSGSGARFNNYFTTTGKSLKVKGNIDILSGGRFDSSVGSTTIGFGALTFNGSSVQTFTVDSSSFLGSSATALTTSSNLSGILTQVIFNNTSTSTPNINWNASCAADVRIKSTVNFQNGRVAVGGTAKFIIGNYASLSDGTITSPTGYFAIAGQGILSGTVGRYWAASATTSSNWINSASDYTIQPYPFISATGAKRYAFISRPTVTGAVAGELYVTYTNSTSMASASVTDGAYTIANVYGGTWAFTKDGTYANTAGTDVAFYATGAYGALDGSSRVLKTGNTAATGTHVTGTASPFAIRAGVTSADLFSGSFKVGASATASLGAVTKTSAGTGDWNTAGTWSPSGVPSCSDVVAIASGHNVTVSTSASAAGVTIATGGTLTSSTGGNLTVGCTNNNASFVNNGTYSISAGTLTVNGSALHNPGSTLVQTGGDIIVDANNAGDVATSVGVGGSAFKIDTPASLNLSAGTITIVDPLVNQESATTATTVSTFTTTTNATTWAFSTTAITAIGTNSMSFNPFNDPGIFNGSVGSVVTGAGIPAGTTVLSQTTSLTGSATIVLSANVTAAIASGTSIAFSSMADGNTNVYFAPANLANVALGQTVTGTGIPAGTTVLSRYTGLTYGYITLSNAVSGLGTSPITTAQTLTFPGAVSGSSALILTAANAAITVGMTVTGTGIPSGTSVSAISGTRLDLTNAATGAISVPATVTFYKANPGSYAFVYNSTAHNVAGMSHTLKFGNGTSTDNTSVITSGFLTSLSLGGGVLSLGNLTIDATNTDRFVSNNNKLNVQNTFTVNSGSKFVKTKQLNLANGANDYGAMYLGGNLVNNGTFITRPQSTTIMFDNLLNGAETPSTIAQTISGTGTFADTYDLASVGSGGTGAFASFGINNTSTGGVTIAVPNFRIENGITMNNGIIHSSSTYPLYHGIVGSATTPQLTFANAYGNNSYIDGPYEKVIGTGNSATTYALYPMGVSATYMPISLAIAGGGIYRVQAYTTNTGTASSNISSLSNKRWVASRVGTTGTPSTFNVRVGAADITSNNTIPVQASADQGTYDNTLGSTSTYAAAGLVGATVDQVNNVTTAAVSLWSAFTGYFSYAQGPACSGTPAPGNTIADLSSNRLAATQNSTATGVVNGSTAVTLSAANASIVTGLVVSGTGIQAGTTVTAITTTALTLSLPATVSSTTAVTLTFNSVSSPTSLCGSQTATLSLQNATSGLGLSYQWQSSIDGGTTYSNVSGATAATYAASPSTNTYYKCNVSCGANTGTSTPVQVTVASSTISGTTPASICSTAAPAAITLGAAAPSGTINWYASATSTTSLGTGTSFTTPAISATTTYYAGVDNTSSNSFARTFTGSTTRTDNYSGMVFNTLSKIVLNTIKVYPKQTSAGDNQPITIALLDSNNTMIAGPTTFTPTSNITTTLTGQTVTLNYTVPVGNGYKLFVVGGLTTLNGIGRLTTNTLPITQGAISITNSVDSYNAAQTATASSTLSMFDWAWTETCSTARTAVTATVTPATTYYQDGDGDGYGNSSVTQLACSTPSGYTATLLGADCNDANSAVTTGTVITTQPSNPSICKVVGATATTTVVASGATSLSYQWYSQSIGQTTWTSLVNNTNYSGVTSATLTITRTTTTVPVTGTKYHVVVSGGTCTDATSSDVTLGEVSVLSKAALISSVATLSPALTICSGSSLSLKLAAGSIGNIQWQSSTDNSTWTNEGSVVAQSAVSATNPILYLTTGALTQDTWYRVVASNGACSSVNGTAVKFTVSASPDAGTILGGDVTVCAPSAGALDLSGTSVPFSNSTTLTLNGTSLGATILWQKSVNYTATTPTWAAAGSTVSSLVVTNLAASTWYRAQIKNGACTVYTTVVKITVSPLAKAGALTSAASVCTGGDISFTSAAYTGTSIAWEVSTTSATTGFAAVSGETSLVFNMTNVTYTPLSKFYVRSVVTSGSCTIARSAVKTITVNPLSVGGTVTGGGTVCNSGVAGTLKLAGNTGKIQWQYSTDNSTWSNAPSATVGTAATFTTTSANATAATYIVSNVTSDTYFRALVTSGACSSALSNAVQYVVGTAAVAGTATATASEVCPATGTTITLAGSTGSIAWKKSTNWLAATPTWSAVTTSVTSTLSTGNLTASAAYKAVVTIGGCSTVESNVVVVTVTAKAVSKGITANVTSPLGGATTPICLSSTTAVKTLTATAGYSGSIQWQSSTTSATTGFTDISGATSTTYLVSNQVAGANYYRIRFYNACTPATDVFSTVITIYYASCFTNTTTPVVVLSKSAAFGVIASPNPFAENFNLSMTTTSEATVGVKVYDMTGRLIEQSEVTPSEVADLRVGDRYPAGVYNIIVTQGENVKTLRVIKR
jgi:Ig-like domain CHU_C associated/Secretion system C-terminal sorting domain